MTAGINSGRTSSLPWPLKIIAIVLVIGVVVSIFSLKENQYLLLGIMISGGAAKIFSAIANIIAPIIIIIGLTKRAAWVWKYAIAYFGFLLANVITGVASFLFLARIELLGLLWPSLLAGVILILLLGLCIYTFWHYRKIFI